MNNRSGCYVFTKKGDVVLVAYCFVHTQYLCVVYQEDHELQVCLCSHAHILDTVPISSVPVPVTLTLENTLELTLSVWYSNIKRALLRNI